MRFNEDRQTGKKKSRDRARDLRESMTPPERKLWRRLRGGRLGGLKFRRQHPVGPYTADFFCAEAGLVVELDGQRHDREHDGKRDACMESLGLSVFRVTVSEFEKNNDGVLASILRETRRLIEERKEEE